MSVPGFVIVSDDEETGEVQTAVIDEKGNQKVVSLEEAGNYRQITHISKVLPGPTPPRGMLKDGQSRKSDNFVRYKCDFCEGMFETIKSLKQHRKENHAGPNGESESKIVFSRIRSATEKRNEEMEALIVKDQVVASRLTEELQALEANISPKRPRYTARRKHQCTACDKAFATPSMLERHQSVHTGKKSRWCELCGKGYSQAEHLQRHMRAVHSESEPGSLTARQKPIWRMCSICGQKFTEKYRYVEHLKVHINGLFQCHLCPRKFSIKNSLVRHIRSHSGERKYECDVCQKRFSDQQTMKNHKRLHTGDYRYRCNVCDKGYSKKSRLVEHMEKHIEECGSVAFEFRCNICQEPTHSLEALEQHKKHHKVKPVEELKHLTCSTQTPLATDESGNFFHCSTCLKGFKKPTDLANHCQVYHKFVVSDSKAGTRFSCDVCQKTFVSREDVQFHMKLHEDGEQPLPVSFPENPLNSSTAFGITRVGSVLYADTKSRTSTTTTTTTAPHRLVTTLQEGSQSAISNQIEETSGFVAHGVIDQRSSLNANQLTIQMGLHVPKMKTEGVNVMATTTTPGLMVPPKKKTHILSDEHTQNVVYKKPNLLTRMLEPSVKQTAASAGTTPIEQTLYAIEENGQLYGLDGSGTMYQVLTAAENIQTATAGWPPTEQQMESGDLLLDIVRQEGSTVSFLSIPQAVGQVDGANVQYVIADSCESSQTTEEITCNLIKAAHHVEQMQTSKPVGK